MNNLIIDKNNFTNVAGKSYGIGSYGCNYPLIDKGVTAVSMTTGDTLIYTSDNFYDLLGCDIQNSNTPLYKYLASNSGFLIEIRNILSSTEALLVIPWTGANGLYDVKSVDVFGQPTVDTTYAIDSSAGSATHVNIETLYGSVDVEVNTIPVDIGSVPVLVNFGADFERSALNIQYSDYEHS